MARWFVLFAAFLLLIPLGTSAQETPSPTPETSPYRVQVGDTLGAIAARYHTTVGQIARLNNLANPEMIVIGQTLQIPVSAPTPIESTESPVLTTSAPLTPSPTPTQTPSVAPAFDYGVEAMFDHQDAGAVAQQITALGMRWAKVSVAWKQLEPTPGNIDFSRLDWIINTLQASQLILLLTVADAPDWARSSHVENGPPDNFADYATFMGALAGHYGQRVRAYEVWNEPNLRREWNSAVHPISADSYADLLRGAYTAIKAAEPFTTVVSAGLAPTGFNDGINALDDRQFLTRLYSLGLAGISDAVGAHPFGFGNPPDSVCCDAPAGVLTHYGHPSFYFLDTLRDYHKIMLANGDANHLIWVTQFGWGTSEDTSAPPNNSRFVRYNTLEKQAEYVPRAFELAADSSFVGVMILYNLNACVAEPENAEACYYSLIAPDGQRRPVYHALSTIFATAVER